jgi:hypothetical protein
MITFSRLCKYYSEDGKNFGVSYSTCTAKLYLIQQNFGTEQVQNLAETLLQLTPNQINPSRPGQLFFEFFPEIHRKGGTCDQTDRFKGTVARDFRPSVFFINQSHLSH